MPHNMTPPLALPDPPDACPAVIDMAPDQASSRPTYGHRRPTARKAPPVEDLALVLVVIGFVFWSIAFAYRMAG